MTNNFELDKLLQRYFPPENVLSCTALSAIDQAMVRNIKRKLTAADKVL